MHRITGDDVIPVSHSIAALPMFFQHSTHRLPRITASYIFLTRHAASFALHRGLGDRFLHAERMFSACTDLLPLRARNRTPR